MCGVYWDCILQVQFYHVVLWYDYVPQGLEALHLEVALGNEPVQHFQVYDRPALSPFLGDSENGGQETIPAGVATMALFLSRDCTSSGM